jgi:hypothetical protein
LELAYAIDVLALNGTADDWVRTVNGHAEQVGRFILHTDEQGFKRLQSFLSDDAASVAISDLAEELDEAS